MKMSEVISCKLSKKPAENFSCQRPAGYQITQKLSVLIRALYMLHRMRLNYASEKSNQQVNPQKSDDQQSVLVRFPYQCWVNIAKSNLCLPSSAPTPYRKCVPTVAEIKRKVIPSLMERQYLHNSNSLQKGARHEISAPICRAFYNFTATCHGNSNRHNYESSLVEASGQYRAGKVKQHQNFLINKNKHEKIKFIPCVHIASLLRAVQLIDFLPSSRIYIFIATCCRLSPTARHANFKWIEWSIKTQQGMQIDDCGAQKAASCHAISQRWRQNAIASQSSFAERAFCDRDMGRRFVLG